MVLEKGGEEDEDGEEGRNARLTLSTVVLVVHTTADGGSVFLE